MVSKEPSHGLFPCTGGHASLPLASHHFQMTSLSRGRSAFSFEAQCLAGPDNRLAQTWRVKLKEASVGC